MPAVDASGKLREGIALHDYPGEGRYEGQFLHGLRQGQGVFTFEGRAKEEDEEEEDGYDDRLRYQGSWQGDVYCGVGTLSFRNGDLYSGAFSAGIMNGKGRWEYASPAGMESGNAAVTFAGTFTNGKEDGEGVSVYSGGDRLTVQYVDGVRSGAGSLHFCAGGVFDRLDGTWNAGRLCGMVTLYFACAVEEDEKTGDRLRVPYRDDAPDGPGEYSIGDTGKVHAMVWQAGALVSIDGRDVTSCAGRLGEHTSTPVADQQLAQAGFAHVGKFRFHVFSAAFTDNDEELPACLPVRIGDDWDDDDEEDLSALAPACPMLLLQHTAQLLAGQGDISAMGGPNSVLKHVQQAFDLSEGALQSQEQSARSAIEFERDRMAANSWLAQMKSVLGGCVPQCMTMRPSADVS